LLDYLGSQAQVIDQRMPVPRCTLPPPKKKWGENSGLTLPNFYYNDLLFMARYWLNGSISIKYSDG